MRSVDARLLTIIRQEIPEAEFATEFFAPDFCVFRFLGGFGLVMFMHSAPYRPDTESSAGSDK